MGSGWCRGRHDSDGEHAIELLRVTAEWCAFAQRRSHWCTQPVRRGCATVDRREGATMTKQAVSAKTRRQFVARSTKASARLERRVVPAEHVRSAKVEKFVESLRSKP